MAVDANTLLSGLFFPGNERRLLMESLHGKVVLVVAEDVVDEIYTVIERTFKGRADLHTALELLGVLLGLAALVGRDSYVSEVGRWAERLRDRSDAPVLACAATSRVEALVTGDREILDLREVGDVKVKRTRDVLEEIL